MVQWYYLEIVHMTSLLLVTELMDSVEGTLYQQSEGPDHIADANADLGLHCLCL